MRAALALAVLLGWAPGFAADPQIHTAPERQHSLDASLRAALRARDLNEALELIGQGADVETHLTNGKTTAMMAAAAGDVAALAELARHGANLNVANHNGGTALLYAALQPDPQAVNWLIRHGATVDHASATGWSALTVAAAKGHGRVVRALLNAGADPNRRDIYGWTPLMRAIDTGHPQAALELLKAPDLTLDMVNDQGQSALHLAAAVGESALVRHLLSQGAAPGRRDRAGRTPADLARAAGHLELAAQLAERSRGAASGE